MSPVLGKKPKRKLKDRKRPMKEKKMFERRIQTIFFWNCFETKHVVQAERRYLKSRLLFMGCYKVYRELEL